MSCGSKETRRSFRQIDKERRELPALFLTAETHKEVIAPGNQGTFVDEKTGELCWPAYTCENPDCPGEEKNGRPHLFIHSDPLVKVGSDGEILYTEAPAGQPPDEYIVAQGGFLVPTCPACLKNRKLETETDKERQKYLNWVKPYILPKTLKRQKELDEELSRRHADLEERRKRKPKPS